MLCLDLCLQVHVQYKVSRMPSSAQHSKPRAGLVQWTPVASLTYIDLHIHWLYSNHRHQFKQLLRSAFIQPPLPIPRTSLQVQSVDVDSIFGRVLTLILVDAEDVSLEL